MSSDPAAKRCLNCERDERETPLICLEYRGQRMWICAQHLPVLIHDPQQLIGKLPGAEGLKPSEIHD
jgi:hypothetical protein